MCQVYGPTPEVGCIRCGGSYYENSTHKCKVFKSFEQWDKELQDRAKEDYTGDNWLFRSMRDATKNVAGWPEWMRRSAWADEYRFSVKTGDDTQ